MPIFRQEKAGILVLISQNLVLAKCLIQIWETSRNKLLAQQRHREVRTRNQIDLMQEVGLTLRTKRTNLES